MSLTIDNESFAITNNGKSFEILKDNASLDRNSERVYMNGFWWDLEKATADGYASLDDLYNTLRDKIDHRYTGAGAITSAEIISALGYTPYSSANPTGFITASSLVGLASEAYVNAQGFLISSDLTPYLTITSASTTYYPLSGNPSGFITASALSPYLLSTTASTTYQPILISGTNLKTINGSSLLGSGDITISGGSIPISGLTAATATNTIDNGAYSQEWQWNSLNNKIGLKLTDNTILGGANPGLLELRRINSINFIGTATVLNVINENTAPSAINIGAHFEGNNYAITTGKTGSGAGFGNIGMQGNSAIQWINGNFNGAYITSLYNGPALEIGHPLGAVQFRPSTNVYIFKQDGTLVNSFGGTVTKQTLGFNGDAFSGYRAASTHTANIENESGTLKLGANTGLAGGYAGYTPNWILNIAGTNQNVGIGTTTPNASAKLDIVSTTQGFLPPRMTATQASAIASPAKSLIVYVTDTNGTFTSAGIWIYTTSWKLILAE